MLTADATEFGGGITIASAQMAKGLEFDVVLVPDVDSTIYSTAMDRSLLYIACTRAMHELHLSYVGDASAFLP